MGEADPLRRVREQGHRGRPERPEGDPGQDEDRHDGGWAVGQGEGNEDDNGAAERDPAKCVYHQDDFFGGISVSNFMFGG